MNDVLEKILKEKKKSIRFLTKEVLKLVDECDKEFVGTNGLKIDFIPTKEIMSGLFEAEKSLVFSLDLLLSFRSYQKSLLIENNINEKDLNNILEGNFYS